MRDRHAASLRPPAGSPVRAHHMRDRHAASLCPVAHAMRSYNGGRVHDSGRVRAARVFVVPLSWERILCATVRSAAPVANSVRSHRSATPVAHEMRSHRWAGRLFDRVRCR